MAMQKSLPDHNPLIAGELICYGCGETIKPVAVKNARGNVEHLLYKHQNEERGCAYELQSTAYHPSQMTGIRPDGTQVKL